MAGNVDAKDFACDTAVEALDHAISLGRIGFGYATGDFEFRAGALEVISGETGSAIRQHMGDAEGKGLSRLCQEGDCIGCIFGVVNGEVHKARAAIDGDIEVALAHLAVSGAQLWQVFDVDMDVAEIVFLEAP